MSWLRDLCVCAMQMLSDCHDRNREGIRCGSRFAACITLTESTTIESILLKGTDTLYTVHVESIQRHLGIGLQFINFVDYNVNSFLYFMWHDAEHDRDET